MSSTIKHFSYTWLGAIICCLSTILVVYGMLVTTWPGFAVDLHSASVPLGLGLALALNLIHFSEASLSLSPYCFCLLPLVTEVTHILVFNAVAFLGTLNLILLHG